MIEIGFLAEQDKVKEMIKEVGKLKQTKEYKNILLNELLEEIKKEGTCNTFILTGRICTEKYDFLFVNGNILKIEKNEKKFNR